jgi:centromere protein X
MPPGRPVSGSNRGRGNSKATRGRSATAKPRSKEQELPKDVSSASSASGREDDDDEVDEELDTQVTIPADLLTRLLHEFFDSDRTRVTRDANATVAKYMDVFVREAIARAAAERERGFLEVRGRAGFWIFPSGEC